VGSIIELRTTAQLRAAQGVGSGAIGGFAVADEVMAAIERSMLAFGGMRQASRILPTGTGGDLPWPTVNDTAQVGELLAENTAAAQQDITFAQIILKAYKYSSKEVLVAQELLEDTSVPIEPLIGELLGERIGRITNTHFTTGDNSSKPQGAITGASNGKTAASATAITIDELLDLFHSVDSAYRTGPNVAFMFRDSTFAAIRKLTKADWAGSVPVWQPGLSAEAPGTILGKPYIINPDIAAIATTAKSVLFGDFSKYIIRDVGSFRLKRLVERYGEKDQVSFVAFSRHDGRVLDAGTDPLKFITQA
jgi:HK97 family phage major capsid protein